MRTKHNKKRNTAFLYEILVRELTKSILEKDNSKKSTVVAIVKEFFNKEAVLKKDLECYKVLSETNNLSEHLAEKLLHETKIERTRLNKKVIFNGQSTLIKKINSSLPEDVWNTFIPNYKSLASIDAIFNQKTPIKKRVLYEDAIVKSIAAADDTPNNLKPMDNIIYRAFVEKFNSQYGGLLEEQKTLLNKYIASFADNGLELKLYLNEEIGRLKKHMADATSLDEISSDETMLNKAREVISILEGFKTMPPSEEMISMILKVQSLVTEISSND